MDKTFLTKVAFISNSRPEILWQNYILNGYKAISNDGYMVNLEVIPAFQGIQYFKSIAFYDNKGQKLNEFTCDFENNPRSCIYDNRVSSFGWSKNGKRFFLLCMKYRNSEPKYLSQYILVYTREGNEVHEYEPDDNNLFLDVYISNTGKYIISSYKDFTKKECWQDSSNCKSFLLEIGSNKKHNIDYAISNASYTTDDKHVYAHIANNAIAKFDTDTGYMIWKREFKNNYILDSDINKDFIVVLLIYKSSVTNGELKDTYTPIEILDEDGKRKQQILLFNRKLSNCGRIESINGNGPFIVYINYRYYILMKYH